MTDKKMSLLERVGDTPVVLLENDWLSNVHIYAKLEFYNPTGSTKDRAAKYLIEKLLKNNEIDTSTTLIESSSGNFGISMAAYCKHYGLQFHCVIDPLISPVNEMIIRTFSSCVHMVSERDVNGGYLINRIQKVKDLVNTFQNSYWVNQYQNPYIAEAYATTLGDEIVRDYGDIDYLFVGVSSGGTITGLSRAIKAKIPNCRVIAVDIEGSVVFGGAPKRRLIPGIGSSMVPKILEMAYIDEVVCVDELSSIQRCHELLANYGVFAGGSSGSVYEAIIRYFSGKKLEKQAKVMAIFCDRGDRYASTFYNSEWVQKMFPNFKHITRAYEVL